MKKTDKKIENSLRKALTLVCEIALDEVAGFEYLTHLVDYNDFPGSLSVICVFNHDNNLSRLVSGHQEDYLRHLIEQKLAAAGIRISDIRQHVSFDYEQARHNQHGGKWHKRIR